MRHSEGGMSQGGSWSSTEELELKREQGKNERKTEREFLCFWV